MVFNSFTLSSSNPLLNVNYYCISGVFINYTSTSAQIIIVDDSYKNYPITIPPKSAINFRNLSIREIKWQSGTVEILYSDKDEGIQGYVAGDIQIKGTVNALIQNSQLDVNITNATINANITNSLIKVTLSGTQVVNVKGTVNASITNSILKVTLSGTQYVTIKNSTVNVNISNSVLKITFSGNQSVTIKNTTQVNITNSTLKVTLAGVQSVNISNSVLKVTLSGVQSVNIANSVLKVTLSGVQSVKISNSTVNVNIANSILKVTFSGVQNVKISNSTVNVNISNSTLKVTFSGVQSVSIKNTTSVNITNSVLKVTLSGVQSVNISNSVLKVTLSGVQSVKLANSTVNVNISNSILKVTFSGVQSVSIKNTTSVNITNSIIKVTLSGTQIIKISNSTFNVSILNSVLKVSFSGTQNINANITNSIIKVTLSGIQNINANITNSVLKITFSGTQSIDANITNSQVNINVAGQNNYLFSTQEKPTTLKWFSFLFYDTFNNTFYVTFSLSPNSLLKIKRIVYELSMEGVLPLIYQGSPPNFLNIGCNPTNYSDSLGNLLWQIQCNTTQNFYPWNKTTFSWQLGEKMYIYSNKSLNGLVLRTMNIVYDIDLSLVNVSLSTFDFIIGANEGCSNCNNGQQTETLYIDYESLGTIGISTGCDTCNGGASTGGSSSSGGCFAEDTKFLVLRKGKVKVLPIKRIRAGDQVFNFKFNRWETVESVVITGFKDVYYFDGIWITKDQPLCFSGVCIPLYRMLNIKYLPRRKSTTYDLRVYPSRQLTPLGSQFLYLDIAKSP